MDLKTSRALKNFKKEAGQINHMLITIYVGLDGIIPYNLAPDPSLHTTWNPKSKSASVDRSRGFARKATMAWMVDCIDMYFQMINQAPMLFLSRDIKSTIDGEDYSRSIYNRVNYVNSKYSLDTIDTAFVDLLICWRNRLVHYSAENDIAQSNRQLLLDNKESILQNFCGLDINKMLEHFDSGEPPTFKEITSLVHAAVNYIYCLDERLIKELDLQCYADRIIIHYLREGKPKEKDKVNPRINNIFSKDPLARLRMVQQLLMQNGFSESETKNAIDEFCEEISRLDYRGAVTALQTGSFLNQTI